MPINAQRDHRQLTFDLYRTFPLLKDWNAANDVVFGRRICLTGLIATRNELIRYLETCRPIVDRGDSDGGGRHQPPPAMSPESAVVRPRNSVVGSHRAEVRTRLTGERVEHASSS